MLGSIARHSAEKRLRGKEVLDHAEGRARELVPRLLGWMAGLDASWAPVPFARFDFLVDEDAGIHLIEITEPGACCFDWAEGATRIQDAMARKMLDLIRPPASSAS